MSEENASRGCLTIQLPPDHDTQADTCGLELEAELRC